MSHYDYVASKEIARQRFSFAAIIMAAMRAADTGNHELLMAAFPHIWAELDERYNAPGGRTPSDDTPDTVALLPNLPYDVIARAMYREAKASSDLDRDETQSTGE